MKTLAFFIVSSLIFAGTSFARSVDVGADQFVKKGIPYCTKKITRGCVKPSAGNTSKYYFAPKYKDKKAVAKIKTKLKSKNKKFAKNTKPTKVSSYHKTKQGKRDIASVLEKKLKSHKKKKKTK